MQSQKPPDAAPRRSRRRRVLIGLAILAAIGTVAATVGIVYLAARLGQIRRVPAAGLKSAGPGSPQTILLTGSDSRAGQSAADAAHFGSAAAVTGQRSDTIILIHVDPGSGKASMLSIPRDLFVPIAGTGASNRINTAFDQSPSVLISTIQQDFGITINHYAQENFTGLQSLTDAVGGVCMNFPYPVRDGAPSGSGNESGLNVPVAGPRVLHGTEALSLVRSRYYQYFTAGTWHAEGTGDIGRIERQHGFMRALASKALHAALGNPFTANAVIGRAVKDVAVDDTFTTVGMLRLAANLHGLRPTGMPSWTLPYTSVSNYRGFGDVLLPDSAADAQTIAAWQSYGAGSSAPPATVAPASVKVKVVNGSGVPGQAGEAGVALSRLGFAVLGTSTADVHHAGSVVTYGTGAKAAAQTVAADVLGGVKVTADGSLPAATVTLTTGTAFSGIAPPAPAAVAAGGPAASAAGAAGAAGAVPPWDPRPC